jgi:hypothetical protein
LEKRAEQILSGSDGGVGREGGIEGSREKWPNVCTYEYLNREKKY